MSTWTGRTYTCALGGAAYGSIAMELALNGLWWWLVGALLLGALWSAWFLSDHHLYRRATASRRRAERRIARTVGYSRRRGPRTEEQWLRSNVLWLGHLEIARRAAAPTTQPAVPVVPSDGGGL